MSFLANPIILTPWESFVAGVEDHIYTIIIVFCVLLAAVVLTIAAVKRSKKPKTYNETDLDSMVEMCEKELKSDIKISADAEETKKEENSKK